MSHLLKIDMKKAPANKSQMLIVIIKGETKLGFSPTNGIFGFGHYPCLPTVVYILYLENENVNPRINFYITSNPRLSYTLSPLPLPHRIALSSAIIVATAPSIFSVDFSLSALMFPAGSVRM